MSKRGRGSRRSASDTEEEVEGVPPPARLGGLGSLQHPFFLIFKTYNCDFVEGHTRPCHPDEATRQAFHYTNRWPSVVRMLLQESRPDVLCLQEVCGEAARPGSAFRAALEAAGLTLAAQAHNPLIVVSRRTRQGDEEGAESTHPNLASPRYVQLWVRQQPGILALVRRKPRKDSTWVSDGAFGIAGGGVVALVRLQGRFTVGLAGVHLQWGGESTLFRKSKALEQLSCTVPRECGLRDRFIDAATTLPGTEPRGYYISGQDLRSLQSEAMCYAVERLLKEANVPQDCLGWLSPCVLLGDTNWRPVEDAVGVTWDESRYLCGPPWRETPGAEAHATYPFNPGWSERYLPRYDRVLVRSLGDFFGRLPAGLVARRLATMGRVGGVAVTQKSATQALLQARPAKLGIRHMVGDAACPELLRGRQLSDHWGVVVRVEFWLP